MEKALSTSAGSTSRKKIQKIATEPDRESSASEKGADRGSSPVGAEKKPAATHESVFPIVGLGASEGGFDALVEFFSQMRPDVGIAFVVVTHQGTDQPTVLLTLLRKCIKMPVLLAVDRMQLEPNCVFVSQPGYLGVRTFMTDFASSSPASSIRPNLLRKSYR